MTFANAGFYAKVFREDIHIYTYILTYIYIHAVTTDAINVMFNSFPQKPSPWGHGNMLTARTNRYPTRLGNT